MKRAVPIDRLREAFDYDPDTGRFVWVGVNKRMFGKRAGAVQGRYRTICVDGQRMFEHRAVWAWVHGAHPAGEIDHINRDGHDNRIANLRVVTRSKNCDNRKVFKNNSLGVRGVQALPNGTFLARLQIRGVRSSIGIFSSVEAAECALRNARRAAQLE